MGPNFCIPWTPPQVKSFCADLPFRPRRRRMEKLEANMNGLRGRRTRVCVSSSHARTTLTVSNSKSCFPVYHKTYNKRKYSFSFKTRRFSPPSSLRYQSFLLLLRQPRSCLAFYIILPLNLMILSRFFVTISFTSYLKAISLVGIVPKRASWR